MGICNYRVNKHLMMKRKIVILITIFAVIMINSDLVAQNPVCAYCGTPLPNGVHAYGCKYYIASASGVKKESSESLNNLVVGALFQGLLNSMFNSNSKNQRELDAKQKEAAIAAQRESIKAAEQQRINQQIAQEEYNKMMKSYKLLDDSHDMYIKKLNTTNMEFKTLDGDAENLSSHARIQFDSTSIPAPDPDPENKATLFFGDFMPLTDIETLVDPENNLNVVDLRNADKYIDENIKNDSSGLITILRKYENDGKGEPVNQKPDCEKIGKKLDAYITQRKNFQKTIDLTRNELDVWETANRNALINAAKDGLEYFTGQLLESLTNRGKAADRLQQIYDKNLKQMTLEGINVSGLQTKIKQLRKISSSGQIAKLATNLNDWQTFIKDGTSALLARLSTSNNEIKNMMDDPVLKKYFAKEQAELTTLLDLSKIAASDKVFGKWIAMKVPLIACVELSIKETYDGLDFLLSFNHIMEAQRIRGEVLNTARIIQKNIDDSYSALKDCPDSI
jgi:hypothetical protein